MLITGEDEGGFSIDEGKSAEICGADFYQRSDTVVEFGSRPAKRVRLLSDSDDPVQEAQVSSFERRGLAQGDLLEEGDGDVGGMSEAHQAYDPVSGVTNGLLSRSTGMKVNPLLHACENMQTRVSTKEDETQRGLLNPESMNGNAGCRVQQDADDTISISGDEAVFVMQVRNPTSKQLLHGRKWSIDQEELRSCDNGSIRHDAKNPVITELCTFWKAGVQNEAETSPNYVDQLDRKQRRSAVTKKVDAEIIGVGKSEVRNVERTSVDSRLNISEQTGDIKTSVGFTVESLNANTSQDVQRASSIDTLINRPDKVPVSISLEQTSIMLGALGGEHEDGVRSVALIAENGCIPTDGLKPLIIEGSNQLDLGLFKNGIKEAGNTRVFHGDTASICSRQEDVQATSDPANEVEAAKVVELVTESSAKEAAAVGVSDPIGCEEESGLNVYVRKRKRSNTAEIATVDSAIEQLTSEDPSGERVIRHYVRRLHRQPGSHSLANVIEKPSQHITTSASNGGKENHSSPGAEAEGNLNVFQRRPKKNNPPQAEHHTSIPAKVEGDSGNLNVFQRRVKKSQHVDISARGVEKTEGSNFNVFHRRSKKNPPPQAEHHSDDVPARVVETEGNVNVFQRRSKMNLLQKEPAAGNDGTIVLQNEVNDNHSPVGYVPADHQPNWLPEGWTLEIRQGKSTARPKDKYYHDYKSGRIFRSKNEVLQVLGGDRMRRDQLMLDQGIGMNKGQVQNKERAPVPIAPAKKQTGFQSPLSKASLDGLVLPLAAPSSPSPNGPVWLPRGGEIGVEQCKGDGTAKDAGALALHGSASNSSPFLSSGDGVHLPTGSPTVKSPSNQGDKGNRGKLIFRLKRKQPDLERGKGRSKRPMYEVVHVEKASSSSTPSTPTMQEKKLAAGERTGQAGAALPSTPDSVEPHVERISSGKESSLSPNVVVVVSGSMPVKAQVLEKHHIPLEKPCPSGPVVMQPTVEQQQPTALLKPGLENHNWGIKHNPLQHGSQQLELLQQESSYTALGIPATARSSGLQQMVSYSANHTHVFLDPVHNTIPLSWQYPFTTHVSTTVTTTPSVVPTLGPFPSVPTPGPLSTRVPVPVFEHFPVHLNATATLVPCSEAGVDKSRKRDSASNGAKLADQGGPQVVHKAPPKSLTKEENTKLLLGLARRLCLAGLEHKKSNLPRLEPLTPATNLEGQKKGKKSSSLQQGVLQVTLWKH